MALLFKRGGRLDPIVYVLPGEEKELMWIRLRVDGRVYEVWGDAEKSRAPRVETRNGQVFVNREPV